MRWLAMGLLLVSFTFCFPQKIESAKAREKFYYNNSKLKAWVGVSHAKYITSKRPYPTRWR